MKRLIAVVLAAPPRGDLSHGGVPMTWRRGLSLQLLAAVALAVPLLALAQQPPLFQTTKITDNVYLFRYGGYQSMFVLTPAGVIATDSIAQPSTHWTTGPGGRGSPPPPASPSAAPASRPVPWAMTSVLRPVPSMARSRRAAAGTVHGFRLRPGGPPGKRRSAARPPSAPNTAVAPTAALAASCQPQDHPGPSTGRGAARRAGAVSRLSSS